jgi:uncharacterized protein with FMN-binding domain
MRRAIIAVAATAIGLVALLDYKSSSGIGASKVSIGPASPSTTPAAISPTSASKSATEQYTGANVSYVYGNIEVRITVDGGRLAAVSTPVESATDPRSQAINAQAIPILTRETLAAQGVNIDVVSGATFTSDAFGKSLQSALAKEGK